MNPDLFNLFNVKCREGVAKCPREVFNRKARVYDASPLEVDDLLN